MFAIHVTHIQDRRRILAVRNSEAEGLEAVRAIVRQNRPDAVVEIDPVERLEGHSVVASDGVQVAVLVRTL